MSKATHARLSGDDYQFLYSWGLSLYLLNKSEEYEEVVLEESQAKAGNIDDVVINPSESSNLPTAYHQLKFHTDHRKTYSWESFISSDSDLDLKKIWDSFGKISKNEDVFEIVLVSNRGWKPGDTLGKNLDAKFAIKKEFITKKSGNLAQVRKKWAKYLEIDDEDKKFIKFIESLRFHFNYSEDQIWGHMVAPLMSAYGFKSDTKTKLTCVSLVRKWIKEKKYQIKKTDVLTEVNQYKLKNKNPSLVLWLHSKEVQKYPEQAHYQLNFTTHFTSKRQIKKNKYWGSVILPEINNLKDTVGQTQSIRDIRIYGRFSLSIGMAFGYVFSIPSGYRLDIFQPPQNVFWSNTTSAKVRKVEIEEQILGKESEFCLAISISRNIKSDVLKYWQSKKNTLGKFMHVTPAGGASNTSLTSDSEAVHFSDEIKKIMDENKSQKTHIFIACPVSMAVILGSKLNASGPIQLYEHSDPGYSESFLLL